MHVPDARPHRVSIVGSTGTGKTTFARDLASIIGAVHIELDALAWGPKWKLADAEVLRARVRDALTADSWVVDGNYGGRGARELVWAAADTIVWLDFSLPVIYRRLWTRTITRIRDGQELWPGTGNRETIRGAFFSSESLFVWVLRTYRRRRREYPALLALPQYAHAQRLRFRSPAEAAGWLERQRSAARI
ncbi:MAG TPA: hypothetical protein VEU77_05290 [Candidatus Acidoferrales bacterium]|nr:hypothetical protein [Candidatus Acidoferrales bacterium]